MQYSWFAFAATVLVSISRPQASGLPLRHALDGELKGNEMIVVEGEAASASQSTLVLRIDDASSNDYGSRVNIERALPPGPFHLETGVRGLRTSSGRLLDLKSVRELRLFALGDGRITVSRVLVKTFDPLPSGAIAYSFGEADAPLFPGFDRVTPQTPLISARRPQAIRRPGPDPLIASGITGIETLKIPWPGGRARVTLWTEDPGDWEKLPSYLQRRIRVNGAEVIYELLTPEQWLQKRYLRGLNDEHSGSDDAWTAYGSKRGGLISFETATRSDGISIEFAGDASPSTFLNAIVVEPAGQTAARDEIEARRAAWYRNTWPVQAQAAPAKAEEAPVLSAVAAPGTGVHLAATITSSQGAERPELVMERPALGSSSLEALVWAAQKRLERQGAGGTVLVLGETMLRAEVAALPLRPGIPRRYDLWIAVPEGTAPGLYVGALGLANDPASRRPIKIEVLPVTLPEVSKPAGFYLDEAPQWSWFWGMKAQRKTQLACDLTTLRSFGITGNAPAITAPFGEDTDAFLSDMQLAAAAQNAAPWLAYSAAKRVAGRVGPVESADFLKAAEERSRSVGLLPPVWSIADEPSNADAHGINIQGWVKALRAAMPGTKLAAQLNSPADTKFVPLFDVAIINQGFGIDERTIRRTKAQGADVWLYNTGRSRATAGLWLWLTEASRYIQWHARMPTADPFDPLDGREGDVQIFFPSVEACPVRRDVHRTLLEMAEGLVDQRWLLWLERQQTAEAAALATAFRQRFGGSFERVSSLTGDEMDAVRNAIASLVKNRKPFPG